MIRLTILSLFVTFLAVYAWRDWYKSVCGLVLLMALVEHPDMPKSILDIQGLNPWNILLMFILPAWWSNRRHEELRWDMPTRLNVLLFMYLAVICIGFLRLLSDPSEVIRWAVINDTSAPSIAGMWSEKLVNSVKWVIPALLLYDGCRDRRRFIWGLTAVLGVYFLLALQVIRWMPLETISSGGALTERSLKIISNEIGYHRVNLAVMLAGGAWAIFAARVLATRRMHDLLIVGVSLVTAFGLALTGGRTGYGTWAVIGLVFALFRWRKYLILGPVLVTAILLTVPAAMERFTQGFTSETRDTNVRLQNQTLTSEGDVDLYTVTAGRNVAWPHVMEKIADAPWIGYGREAMQTTGIAAMLLEQFGESFPHPHNAYLQLLLDNGLIGTISVLLFYLLVLKYAMSLFRDSSDPIFATAGGVTLALVLALMIGAIGSQTFYPREGALGMWCAIGLMLRVYVERARILAAVRKPADPAGETGRKLWPQPI